MHDPKTLTKERRTAIKAQVEKGWGPGLEDCGTAEAVLCRHIFAAYERLDTFEDELERVKRINTQAIAENDAMKIRRGLSGVGPLVVVSCPELCGVSMTLPFDQYSWTCLCGAEVSTPNGAGQWLIDQATARAAKAETDLAWMKDSRSTILFELYETKVALFYLETGLLAPGKDWPAAGAPRPKETNHRWDEWDRERGFGDGCKRPGCEFCAAEDA